MNEPAEIEIAPEHLTVDTVTQELYHVSNEEKFSLLLGVLAKEQPKNCLIFTNMKQTTVDVARRLSRNGLDCDFITGDLPQKERLKVIEGLKSGRIRILVATNVASRGLHVDDLDLVINYDLPEDCEDYVHRIGRTARAGKQGKAVSLACESYLRPGVDREVPRHEDPGHLAGGESTSRTRAEYRDPLRPPQEIPLTGEKPHMPPR